ncbi:DUF7288 family protein [Halorhabdus salina]|uniref:DUF7288 family protein n=1 Tax=Halorhabdus salina TaxID=2750670 RepID=UPI0015EFAE07|nr:hypothetical protein [Halorhabdus salina]
MAPSADREIQRPPRHDGRAQAHTLEGIIAGLLVLSSIGFALQVTAVTPLSASTSSQHIQNQQRAAATGVLASAAESGALERAVLSWNESGPSFHETGPRGRYASAPPNDFGALLTETFDRRSIAYNVDISYAIPGGERRRIQMVYQGVPSDSAVRASRLVTLTAEFASQMMGNVNVAER